MSISVLPFCPSLLEPVTPGQSSTHKEGKRKWKRNLNETVLKQREQAERVRLVSPYCCGEARRVSLWGSASVRAPLRLSPPPPRLQRGDLRSAAAAQDWCRSRLEPAHAGWWGSSPPCLGRPDHRETRKALRLHVKNWEEIKCNDICVNNTHTKWLTIKHLVTVDPPTEQVEVLHWLQPIII